MQGSFKIIGLILSLMLVSTSFAQTKHKIHCPKVSTIQQAANKVNTASQFDESWIAHTSSPFYENGKNWIILVELNAKSKKQAIKFGKKAVQAITYAKYKHARKPDSGRQYGCEYGPENRSLVSAVIPR